MKSLKFARLAAVAAVATLSSAAFAADSTTLAVSATVNGVCKLTNSSGTVGAVPLSMSWAGGIDPTSTGNADTAAVPVYFKCSLGSSPVLSVGGSNTGTYGGTATGAGGNLAYSVIWTNPVAGSGAGFSAGVQTVNLVGRISQAAYQAANAGTYTDSVAVTLAP
jgi:spore coat protein U-like protein